MTHAKEKYILQLGSINRFLQSVCIKPCTFKYVQMFLLYSWMRFYYKILRIKRLTLQIPFVELCVYVCISHIPPKLKSKHFTGSSLVCLKPNVVWRPIKSCIRGSLLIGASVCPVSLLSSPLPLLLQSAHRYPRIPA